jgi:hypothetical protein
MHLTDFRIPNLFAAPSALNFQSVLLLAFLVWPCAVESAGCTGRCLIVGWQGKAPPTQERFTLTALRNKDCWVNLEVLPLELIKEDSGWPNRGNALLLKQLCLGHPLSHTYYQWYQLLFISRESSLSQASPATSPSNPPHHLHTSIASCNFILASS